MENLILQKNISAIMNKGFEKAAKSFSQVIGRKLSHTPNSIIWFEADQKFPYASGQQGNLMVLTTNMIGDLAGRSFLIITERERSAICKSVSPVKELEEKLQEALLLEIDNIISASVIGQFADDLGIEVYGDVPNLQYVKAEGIQQFLSSGISQESQAGVLLCDTTFQFDNLVHIHPRFIWKLGAKVFQMIQQQAIL